MRCDHMSSDKKINIKNVLAGAVILAIIVGAAYYVYRDSDDESHAINVSEITDGYEDDLASIQYNDGEYMFKFEHSGLYKGFPFLGDVKFTTEENETYTLMRTTADMRPGDEVPEAYIVPNLEEGVMIINIYLDDDFKNLMGNRTNIIWGSEYQNFRKYDYSREYKPGIYVDIVLDHDAERFKTGGNDANVFVGDATLEDAQNRNMVGITGVFLK